MSRFSPISVLGSAFRLPGCVDDLQLAALLDHGGRPPSPYPQTPRWWTQPDVEYQAAWAQLGCALHLLEDMPDCADRYQLPPGERATIDPLQKVALLLTEEAMLSADLPTDRLAGRRVGVYFGICHSDHHLSSHRNLDAIGGNHALGSTLSAVATRVAYTFDLKGPALTLDTACSSGLVALHYACRDLAAGDIELAVVGALNLISSPEVSLSLDRRGVLSKTGRTRPFDDAADGYVRGEGAIVLILRRAEDGADGVEQFRILATHVEQDGRSNGFLASHPQALEDLMAGALERAGLRASEIDFLEAQGTGSRMADALELEAIAAVMGGERPTRLLLGAVKADIGHLEAASGLAGLLKAAVVLRRRVCPAQAHFDTPNRWAADALTRLEIPYTATPFGPAGPRARGLVNCFGIGGTNACAAIEA